jgi:actin-related protein 2
MDSSNVPIVMDSGTGYMKIGFAGENFPRTVFPAMIGRPMLRFEEKIDDIELKVKLFHKIAQDIMIGDEAAPLRSLLELSHPVEEGIVKNWDEMKLIMDYAFKKVEFIK